MRRILFRLEFNPCDTLACVNGTCFTDNSNIAACACIGGYRGRLCEEGWLNSTVLYVKYVYCMPLIKCYLPFFSAYFVNTILNKKILAIEIFPAPQTPSKKIIPWLCRRVLLVLNTFDDFQKTKRLINLYDI